MFASINDRASVTKTVDLGSIPGRAKPKIIKIGIHSFLASSSAIKRVIAKTPQCVVNRWTSGSLTRGLKDPFAVSWPRQLGE